MSPAMILPCSFLDDMPREMAVCTGSNVRKQNFLKVSGHSL